MLEWLLSKEKETTTLVRMWKKGNPQVEMHIGATNLEKKMKIPQKVKNRTTKWSRNSTFGYLT